MPASRILIASALLLLAGCGRTGDLKPIPGQEPIKPLMAKRTPTAEELLTVPPYARPDRVDELIRRSRPRQSDPFDLPPPTGSAAPPLPAGTDPEPVTNETGPATPK
jgi:hypothetical protein